MAKGAFQTKKVIKGVKNNSVMMLVPNSDIILGYPPEYMHACLLGIAKLFAIAWFSSTNNEKPWYLGTKTEEYNRKLNFIKPPTEITRSPTSITDGHFKANDRKYHTRYHSIHCLKDLLPTKYLNHWFLFVYSMSIFLKKKIINEEFNLAKMAL